MAARTETSRSQLDCLLDPDNEGVTLHVLKRAAVAVGIRLEIELRQHGPGGGDGKRRCADPERADRIAGYPQDSSGSRLVIEHDGEN